MSRRKKIQFCIEFVGVIIIIFCICFTIMVSIPPEPLDQPDFNTFNKESKAGINKEVKSELSKKLQQTKEIGEYCAGVDELKKALMYFFREQKWQDAETTLRIMIDLNQKRNNKKELAENYCLLGFVLRKQGKQQQELQAYKQELEIARGLSPRDPSLECDALINMGGVQVSMKQFKDAEKTLKEAKKIARDNDLDNLMTSINNNLWIAEQKLPIKFLVGQLPEKRKGTVELDVKQARKVAKALLETIGKDNPALNVCAYAVRQPDFSGVVAEEGCVAKFNDDGEVIYGITTRVYDYKTGQKIRNRSLTERELKNANSALKSYYEDLNIPSDIKTIVVFSDSFKAAACEAILNMAEGKKYFLEAEGKVAKMYKVEDGERELIASEMIYYKE